MVLFGVIFIHFFACCASSEDWWRTGWLWM